MAGRICRKYQQRRRLVLRNYRRYTLYFDSHFRPMNVNPLWTQQALWSAQERERCEALLEYRKLLHHNQTTYKRGGVKLYKQKYHRMRRRQSRALCYSGFYHQS